MTDRLLAITIAAAAYSPTPGPGIQRIGWRDVSADLSEIGGDIWVAVRGTDPEILANLLRDANVRDEPCRDHPVFGPLFAGALDAAEGLLPAILAATGDRRIFPLGHSLGGQIAVDLAALLLPRVSGFWGFDPPKSGGLQLADALSGVSCNIDRFAGSIVSRWPFDQGVHVRTPELIGDWTLDWLEAHSIERARAWVARSVLTAQKASSPQHAGSA